MPRLSLEVELPIAGLSVQALRVSGPLNTGDISSLKNATNDKFMIKINQNIAFTMSLRDAHLPGEPPY